MGNKVLTPAAAMEAKRLYAEVDERGRRRYSQMQIADMLGVGETTIFRVLKRQSAYAAVRELPTDAEAAASEARFLALMQEQKVPKRSVLDDLPTPELRATAAAYLGQPPANPLEEDAA